MDTLRSDRKALDSRSPTTVARPGRPVGHASYTGGNALLTSLPELWGLVLEFKIDLFWIAMLGT